MRNRFVPCLLVLLAAPAAMAAAQAPPPVPVKPAPALDVGVRLTDVTGDEARFQRFRDVSDGFTLNRARFNRKGTGWFLELGTDHSGREDQRYFGRLRASGRLKASFLWDQVPLFYSRDTRTAYTTAGTGTLVLPDALQLAVQNGQGTTGAFATSARPFDLQSRRDTAQVSLLFSATRQLDLTFNLTTAHRHGAMPLNASFSFGNVVELAAPLDTRTSDVRAGAEWVNPRGMLRVSYDGSWFDNHASTLVWDNPQRLTDIPTAGAQGRYDLWPNSRTDGVTTAGSIKLPAHSRASGNITVGSWRQNDALLPVTINSAIPAVALPRATADADARTLAMNYTLTSQPVPHVWLNARFRYYDFDNRTPTFETDRWVLMDQGARPMVEGSKAFSFTRQNLDLDLSLTPIPFTAIRLGYAVANDDRAFRIFEQTREHVARVSIDSVSTGLVTVRGIVERAVRRGSRFDGEILAEMGDQPGLRHYDIADRDRSRVTGLVQFTPVPAFGVSGSASVGRDEFPHSDFGLRSASTRAYSLTMDLVPREAIAAGITFVRDRYAALQRSRTANPGVQFTDPTRDWAIDAADRANTVTANVDLVKLLPRTTINLSYALSRSTGAYDYQTPANSSLAPLAPLPPVRNELQSGIADVKYLLTPKVALGVMFWHDQYAVDDFALGPATLNRLDLPSSLYLGDVNRPYTANSGSVRVIYFW